MARRTPSDKLRISISLTLLFALVFNAIPPVHAAGVVILVAVGGAQEESCGKVWASPCDLQYALQTLAKSGDQIWVKEGIYYPTEDGTNRSASFQIKDGLEVYGGFNGTETSLTARVGRFSETILSGDIDHATFPDIASPAADANQLRGANAYHVITLFGVSENTTLDGFTVTAGQAVGEAINYPEDRGGGIRVHNGVPILSNLIVTGNTAGSGGGISIWENDHDPVQWTTQPILKNLYISGNSAASGAGVEFGGAGSPYEDICGSLENVSIIGNRAETGMGYGGGLASGWCKDLRLNNVTINGNTAVQNGGGIFDQLSNITLNHVTLSGNVTQYGGEEIFSVLGRITASNTIIWNSNPDLLFTQDVDTILDFTYSDIRQPEGTVFPGEGNINADPLLGTIGDYGGSTPTIPLLPGSLAIDTANPGNCLPVDQRGASRPHGEGCDMGAYEARTFTIASLRASNNPSVAGQPITLFVTINTMAPPSEAVTQGTVTLYQGTTVLGHSVLDNNGEMYHTLPGGLPVGKHPISAVYNGNANYEKSDPAIIELIVDPALSYLPVVSTSSE